MRIAEPYVDLWREEERLTQLLWGERVIVLDRDGDQLYVEALDQPCGKTGYRGWMEGELREDGPAFPQYTADRHLITQMAREWLDVPYLWGGLTGEGIDCSGFVHLLYRLAGQAIPRDAKDQYAASRPVAALEPADLIFTKKLDHVLLYLGDETVIEAAGSAGKVRLAPLDLTDKYMMSIMGR